MAYQSLYRRYRPQKFSEIRGQQHIVAALKNAVAKGEVGHAYMFHGPRGTGKTTSARVLAKALNCTNLGEDAEPCGECESCHSIEEGRSFDLHELDAASNNGVDDMRDLLAKVSLGNPGNAKVYILDEVHMLTRGAENALLKTLEEPPEHVIWVLATTEPHKVVQTIRSRCQVFELGLLGAEEMAEHVRWVAGDAELDIDETVVEHVVSAGGGSVRDTLSALDRVVAAGGVVEIDASTDLLLSSLADRDAAAALASVGDAMGRGKDPRTIGEAVLAGLREAFLTAMGSAPPRLTPSEMARAEDLAARMTPATMTRALETLGSALVDMRQAPDPRVDLEVALVRLCRPDADRSLDAVIERLDQLEAQLGGAAPIRPAAAVAPAPVVAETPAPAPSAPAPAPVPSAPEPAPVPEPTAPAPDPAAATGALPPPPAVAEAPVEAVVDKSLGPAAAARAALADKTGRPAPPIEPIVVDTTPAPPPPPVPTAAPAPVAADAAPAASGAANDLTALRPTSPSEVVKLAAEHLGIDKDTVVSEANALLGPSSGGRSADDLAQLWLHLVDGAGAGPDEISDMDVDMVPGPAPEPAPVSPSSDIAPDPGYDPTDPGPMPDDAPPAAPVLASVPEPPAPAPAPVAAAEPEAEPEPDGPVADEDVDLHDLVDAPAHNEQIIERLTEAFPGAEVHIPEEPES